MKVHVVAVMKVHVVAIAALFFSSNLVLAQLETQNPSSRPGVPNEHNEQTVLTGKVTLDDNSPPPNGVIVALECIGRQPMPVNSDLRGDFSISIQRADRSATANASAGDSVENEPASLSGCDLIAKLVGYTAEPLHLFRQATDVGMVNVGTIVLHPTAQAQTFAVSVSSLAAPDKAKAAFEKGEEQKNKGKWAAAMESFRKAIAVYPRYGLAWLELGRVQETQHNFADAQQSFHESVTQDSKLVEGYIELARLAAKQGQWQDLLSASDHLVQFHPESPEFWFLNSAANFNLGEIKQAETSVTRGLRIDSAHRVPQMEYLYALILARRQDFQSAADHTAAYLKFSPHAADAVQAQKNLAEFQRLATASASK